MVRKAAERGIDESTAEAVVGGLLGQPGAWLSTGAESGVVVSSRVRLARNVKKFVFPGWSGEAERLRLCARLREALSGLPALPDARFLDMGALSSVDKEVLTERHLISHEMAERGAGSALVLTPDERVAVMINEEDHLRLQALTPGMHLEEMWRRIDAVDTETEGAVEYAFSHRLGYLTACPSNLGTALRASVMMHLPGLKLLDEIGAVINGLEKIGFAVRGLLGEGTEANGNMFQISNQMSIGTSEAAIIDNLMRTVREVEQHERNARARLMEGKRTYLADQIGRALGVLLHARVLASKEAIELLSGVRLGVEMGLIDGLGVGAVNEVLLVTQPGHLQRMARRAIKPEERDELRAGIVSRKLARGRLRA